MNFMPFVPPVPAPAGGGLQPWQFTPEQAPFGAKGDGKVLYDATITGGALSTLTSTSAPFTSADTGKHILVNTVPAFHTTITFVNSTTVTLGSAAPGAVASAYACYGTDDTAALNAMIAAGSTYAQAHGWYAEYLFGPKIYVVAGALIQGGATFGNAQLPLPVIQSSTASPTLTLAFTGVRAGAGASMFTGTSDPAPGPGWEGTVLFSFLTGATFSNTFGVPSLLAGPTPQQGFTGQFTDLWSNVMPVVQGITFMVPLVPTITTMDFRGCVRMLMPWARSTAFASFTALGVHDPSAGGAAGLYTPQQGNNAHNVIGSYAVSGFNFGAALFECTQVDFIITSFCNFGVYVEQNGGHGISISQLISEACDTHLTSAPLATDGGPWPIEILCFQAENASQWNPGFYIDDRDNTGAGLIRLSSSQTGFAAVTVNGGASLEIIYDGVIAYTGTPVIIRGFQTPPAVPLTTVQLQNPFWRHATVYVQANGAAVTAIAVGGVTIAGLVPAGTVPVPVRVPSGYGIALTYTGGPPTWQWMLD